MSVTQNGSLRSRRPQLNDTITKLDEMVDGLATAIPAAVADSIREALGPVFAAAVKSAVKEAVAEAMKEQGTVAVKPAPVPPEVPPPPTPPTPTKPSVWVRVRAALSQLKVWAVKKAAPVVARATLGWAIVRVIGVSTIHSRTALVSTMAAGFLTAAGGYALGPVGAAILLGLASSAIAACATWAAPAARFLTAFPHE